ARTLNVHSTVQHDILPLKHAFVLKQCRANLLRAQVYQKKYADKKRRPVSFRAGDKVWLSSQHIGIDGFSTVLKDRYLG
ncbi:transposon related, partial [Cystoisospora suis]